MTPSQETVQDLNALFGPGQPWISPSGHRSMAWQPPAFHLLWCDEATNDTGLRRLWEARKSRQAHLVILLAPAGEPSACKVIGPQQAQPVRELPTQRVVALLQQARTMMVCEAATVLAREFQRYLVNHNSVCSSSRMVFSLLSAPWLVVALRSSSRPLPKP